MKWLALLLISLLFGLLLWAVFSTSPQAPAHQAATIERNYGVRNAVTAVVLGARLWDTLIEVLVFVVAMVGVRFGLSPLPRERKPPPVAESQLLREMFQLVFLPIALLAVYLAASGHLGPGGGFPAGAILGSGLLLLALAIGMERLAEGLHETHLERLEYGAVAALLLGGLAMILSGVRTVWWFVAANLVIALEVAIGAWVVLHRFSAHRGEL